MASDDSMSSLSPLSSLGSQPSSPLSTPSRSPTPPAAFAYPSPLPSSQQSSVGGTPCPENEAEKMVRTDSSASATKRPRSEDGDSDATSTQQATKRRRSGAIPRTMMRLDLTEGCGELEPQKSSVDRLLKVLYKKKKIVVVAGAGISVSAGIPDFRSSTGLFKTLRKTHNVKGSGKNLFDASVYKDDASTRTFHSMLASMESATREATPTDFHHLLASLAQQGRLLRLYTQNVDSLDTRLQPLATRVPLTKDENNAWPRTLQLHGNLETVVCTKCGNLSKFDAALFDSESPPSCEQCAQAEQVRTEIAGKRGHGVGRLRPRMVLYNEHNPDDEAIGSVVKADLRTRPDALIVVGTTLKVPGIKRIVREMSSVIRDRKDGLNIWINRDPEPTAIEFKDTWDLIVKGDSDEVARLAALRRWDCPTPIGQELTDEEWKIRSAAVTAKVEVRVGEPAKRPVISSTSSSSSFKTDENGGLLTPAASPCRPSWDPLTPIGGENATPATPSGKATSEGTGSTGSLIRKALANTTNQQDLSSSLSGAKGKGAKGGKNLLQMFKQGKPGIENGKPVVAKKGAGRPKKNADSTTAATTTTRRKPSVKKAKVPNTSTTEGKINATFKLSKPGVAPVDKKVASKSMSESTTKTKASTTKKSNAATLHAVPQVDVRQNPNLHTNPHQMTKMNTTKIPTPIQTSTRPTTSHGPTQSSNVKTDLITSFRDFTINSNMLPGLNTHTHAGIEAKKPRNSWPQLNTSSSSSSAMRTDGSKMPPMGIFTAGTPSLGVGVGAGRTRSLSPSYSHLHGHAQGHSHPQVHSRPGTGMSTSSTGSGYAFDYGTGYGYRNSGTISPTGALPRGLERLIH